MARLDGLNYTGASKAPTQLVEHEMVLVEPVSAANASRLNRQHLPEP